MRILCALLLIVLCGCADADRYVDVVKINENNLTQKVEFQFIPTGTNDIDFVLRYDRYVKTDVFPVVVKVGFEDSTYYEEKINLVLKREGVVIGQKKGNIVDLEVKWRRNVTMQKKGTVKIVITPDKNMVDWEGFEYFGVKISNARKS